MYKEGKNYPEQALKIDQSKTENTMKIKLALRVTKKMLKRRKMLKTKKCLQ